MPSLEVVVGPGAAHQESSPQCFKLAFTIFLLYTPLYSKKLVQLVSTVSHCFDHILHE